MMDPISSTPSFPWEIFNLIIEELVEDPDSLPQNINAFNAVKQCSIVCKSFTALCQPYVFRVIRDIHWQIQDSTNRRMKKFVHVIQSNPNLSHYVRHLHVKSPQVERLTSSRDEVSEAIEVLKGFPNLIELDVENHWNRDKPHPQYFYDALHGLIDTYVSQGTFHSLSVSDLDNLHFDDIFLCSTIRALRLRSFIMPSLTMSAPHITRLDISQHEELDLSVLSFFPNLQEFSIGGRLQFVSTHDDSAPSFGLRVLRMSIYTWGEVTPLLDYYHNYAEMTGVQPFGKLEELEYCWPFTTDIEAVERMLQTTTLLKVLNINLVLGLTDMTSFPLARLQLSNKILNVFPHLTRLMFDLPVHGFSDYTELLTEFADILVDIEGNNVIEDVAISIKVYMTMFTSIPSGELWSRMSRALSSCTGYPKLKKVSMLFVIFATTSDSDWGRNFDEDRYMSHAMKEVAERKGVEFQGKLYIMIDRYRRSTYPPTSLYRRLVELIHALWSWS